MFHVTYVSIELIHLPNLCRSRYFLQDLQETTRRNEANLQVNIRRRLDRGKL